MIRKLLGDITKVETKYICNAANGIGPMGGGVAAAIKRAGGAEIENEAIATCQETDPMPGDIYVTTAGKLPYEKVIHLVTMKQPGGPTSYEIIERCLQNLVAYCEKHNISEVALPSLGTGVGGLDKKRVAELFKEHLRDSEVEFLVVDIDEEFVGYVS